MLKIDLGLLLFVLWLFCLIDAIVAPEERVRHLQKTLWVLIVIFLPFIGSVAWLVAGRPQGGTPRRTSYSSGSGAAFPEYDRPGRFAATDPEKDEEFLRQIRERAEAQRKAYEQSRKPQPEDPAADF